MALVICTDLEDVNVRALGNWFSFKSGQIKNMDDKIAHFICVDKAEYGFQTLPDICFEDPNCKESIDAKATAIKQGRNNIIKKLHDVIRNLEVSLQRDLDIAGIKTNVLTQASDGELNAYRRLAKFEALKQDEEGNKLKEIMELKGKINGDIKPTDAKRTA